MDLLANERFGLYSIMQRTFLGKDTSDGDKLKFLDSPVGLLVSRVLVWENEKLGDYKVRVVSQRVEAFAERDAEEADAVAADLSRAAPVVLFSFTCCPWCVRAKAVLREHGADPLVVELDERDDGAAMQAALGRLTGRTSMPCVFLGGECIGGCDDGTPGLLPLLEGGQLVACLRAAGVESAGVP